MSVCVFFWVGLCVCVCFLLREKGVVCLYVFFCKGCVCVCVCVLFLKWELYLFLE